MKPSAISSQYSLYSQVQEAKSHLEPLAMPVEKDEKDIPTKASVKNIKTLSPTKTIGVVGAGLIGLTGLYMLGQKARDFLFGEASKPSPTSVPPTPVASEVVEEAPAPEKNVVQKATQSVRNRWSEGVDNHNRATDKAKDTVKNFWQEGRNHHNRTTQEAKERVVKFAQTIFEAPGKLVPTVESYIQAGMGSVQRGVEATQIGVNSAIVHVAQNVVQKPFDAGMDRQTRAFTWLEKWLLRFHDATFKPASEQLAKINAPSVPVEVLKPDPPPKPKGFLKRAIITVNTTAQHIPESAKQTLQGVTHEVTRMTDAILDEPKKQIKAGKAREAKAFTWLNEKLWKPTGLNVLEAENPHVETSHYPPLLEGVKDQGDNVIEVVAERIKETAKEASQGVTHQTRKMKNTATHMAIETADYMPTTTTGSAGLDLFAMAMHALYGAGKKASKRFKIFKP